MLGVSYCIAKSKNKSSEEAVCAVKRKHLSAALFLAFLVYSSVSFTIFQAFVCDELDDGNTYLRADYRLTCTTKTHMAYKAYASFMVFVYPIGIPTIFAALLAANRGDLKNPNRDLIPRLQPLNDLWSAYKPSRYYYEVIECCRRIALTGVAIFVLPGSAAQIAIVLLIAAVFLFISESMDPFDNSTDMGLYRWGNGVILSSMYVGLLLKFDTSYEDTMTMSAFTGVLIAANVFMVVAVLVQSVLLVVQSRSDRPALEVVGPVNGGSSLNCRDGFGDEQGVGMRGVLGWAKADINRHTPRVQVYPVDHSERISARTLFV